MTNRAYLLITAGRLMTAGLLVVVAACGGGGAATTLAPTAPTTTAPATGGEAPATPAPPTTDSGTTTTSTTVSTSTAAPTTSTAPRADFVIDVTIAGGAVTGPDRPEVAVGATVLLRVTSDVADEAHVHGYDYYVDVVAGDTAELEFVADIPGIFEIELESAGTLLVELVVR